MGTLSRCHIDSVNENRGFPEILLQAPSNHPWSNLNPCQGIQASSHDAVGGNTTCEGDVPVACDYFDGVYEYIKQMLMEEDDLEHRPCMFQDCSALQAAEKYFYDALSNKDLEPNDSNSGPPPYGVDNNHPLEIVDLENLEFGAPASGFGQWSFIDQQICGEGLVIRDGVLDSSSLSPFQPQIKNSINLDRGLSDINVEDPQSRKKHGRGHDSGDHVEGRSSKQIASCEDDNDAMDQYDKAFLCHQMNPGFYDKPRVSKYEETSEDEVDTKYSKKPELRRGRPKGSTKNKPSQVAKPNPVKEAVDLRTLLTRCATAVSSFNTGTAQELLMKIRQHSSPYGDANERLAHCFANALEARAASTGSMLYTAISSKRTTASELLKSYRTYVTACPFKRMSNVFANKSIAGYTLESDKIHIIDFGILYGFQWPCIIQGLSLRPGGPPFLKITGIDFPQPGFKPAERVEQTGRRLMSYCKRFKVPFEYNGVAKKWDEIRMEDLKIERDEMLVANCLYRLRHVPDESAGVNSPRDAILKFIKKMKPALFVHGVVNGTYNTPFFASRFKEALFHYSSIFDMLEATIPREDQDRLLYEREVFGREVMNVVACEEAERVERPESYKQWHVRNHRAGFRPIPLNPDLMREIKTKVRKGYHNDFMVEEDSEWMLQGWKGRVMYALSCWKPYED
ncbi:scarecrow-like protein 9 [Dorcoceras hygrometricum]|uniref:Scarecrow-like protein 9 n=1 Tax=Dorcoceras hygrometricum TaxID=472368 RepID=A0A2Z7BA48_9LAMI|nr:scarecrow-like protein 9 [Dorcoceras hygrometricum]